MYCEKQRKMRGEVASLNKIVVSSLSSRDLAWTKMWYSRSTHTLVVTLVQVYVACVTCTCSVALIVSYVMRYHVQCWYIYLCNEFEFVMNKDDFDTTVHLFYLLTYVRLQVRSKKIEKFF